MTSRGGFEPYDFRIPFGLVAILVGFWFLYAVFAGFLTEPVIMDAGEECVVTDSPGVHFTADWTFKFSDGCGDYYPYHRLYFLGFVIAGIILIHGGAKTVWEEYR